VATVTQEEEPKQDEGLPVTDDPRNPNLLRDRLANERTFLAWLRTAIAITAMGFVVARFELLLSELAILEGADFDDSILALTIGILLVLTGPFMAVTAAVRFRSVERRLMAGLPNDGVISVGTVMVLALAMLFGGVGIAVHLLDRWPH
jgi:putative membrane protein